MLTTTWIYLNSYKLPIPTQPVNDEQQEYLLRREKFKMSKPAKKIPCCLVTGEFGSGKTSLIKHLLQELKRENFTCGVIVNDFCDLNIDVTNLRQVNQTVYAFSDHCCCCLLKPGEDELKLQIENIRKDANIDVLLIEMNGMSQVSRAIGVVDEFTRLDSIIGVVDAGNNNVRLLSPQFAETCDVILLNKADECTPQDLEAVSLELKQSNNAKLEIIQTNWGKLPIDRAFRVKRSEFVPGQMSVREARQSSRYELVLDDDDFLPSQRSIHSSEPQPLAHDLDVKWKLLVSNKLISLARLQQQVVAWHQSAGLRRIKGRVWLTVSNKAPPQSYEFQFSGRGRLQCTRIPAGISSQTRLAVVSTVESDFAPDLFDKEHAATQLDNYSEVAFDLLTTKFSDRITTWEQQEDENMWAFRVTCINKFGFTEDVLLQRFGLDLTQINLDFHSRFNAFPGPELVAFDGHNLFICKSVLLQCSIKFEQVLQSIIDSHFAVVKLACRCDA